MALTAAKVARQSFGRGLCVVSDQLMGGGRFFALHDQSYMILSLRERIEAGKSHYGYSQRDTWVGGLAFLIYAHRKYIKGTLMRAFFILYNCPKF